MALIYTNSSYHYLVNNVDTAAIPEILDTQPGECNESEYFDVNNESGCNDKNKGVSREWQPENTQIRNSLNPNIFCNTESTKDKMIEA